MNILDQGSQEESVLDRVNRRLGRFYEDGMDGKKSLRDRLNLRAEIENKFYDNPEIDVDKEAALDVLKRSAIDEEGNFPEELAPEEFYGPPSFEEHDQFEDLVEEDEDIEVDVNSAVNSFGTDNFNDKVDQILDNDYLSDEEKALILREMSARIKDGYDTEDFEDDGAPEDY